MEKRTMVEPAQQPEWQQTLKGSASFSGIALHTGHRVKLTLLPALENTGVRFRRMDLPGRPEVLACGRNVTEVRRATTITDGLPQVHTVEHVLATANALNIDNLLVEMDGPEPPIGDGSALPFVELFRTAGIQSQKAPKKYVVVRQPEYLEMGETRLMVVPDERFRISCTIQYHETPLDCQYLSLEVTAENFTRELAQARTFCLYQEIEALVKANLIAGGSLDNAVVIKGDAILSKDGLRYPDELVRHKMLDLVGDFYLLGGRLRGHVIAIKPGHNVNVQMVRRLMERHCTPD